MSNKNIDQLFQEKLQSFEELPDEGVWNSIEASLDKKQKKRVLPIWWTLGGVAAVLAILLFSIYPFDFNSTKANSVTDVEHSKDVDTPVKEVSPKILQNEEEFTATEGDTTNEDVPISNPTRNNTTPVFIASQENAKDKGPKKKYQDANTALAQGKHTTPIKANTVMDPANGESAIVLKEENATIAGTTAMETPTSKHTNATLEQKQAFKKEANSVEEGIAAVSEDKKTTEEDKKSIFDVIAEEEEEIIVDSGTKKWAISPAVAPIYFDSFGDGSPIDPSFSPNSKSGNVNLSYGLSVSYNVSKKISVRTGVHRVDYGYNTNDIVFSSSVSTARSGNLSNIDLDPKSQNIVLQSAAPGTMNALDAAPSNPNTEVFQAFDPALNGRIVQQLGYLEVPLEVNYALIDNKWGVNVIGGLSSLFLIDNAISLESEGLVTEIGKANNLNMVNFSTNIGLGVHYRFSPKIQWNVEPIFKYQLNTFSGATGDFQPFSLGVYSGFSFKF